RDLFLTKEGASLSELELILREPAVRRRVHLTEGPCAASRFEVVARARVAPSSTDASGQVRVVRDAARWGDGPVSRRGPSTRSSADVAAGATHPVSILTRRARRVRA